MPTSQVICHLPKPNMELSKQSSTETCLLEGMSKNPPHVSLCKQRHILQLRRCTLNGVEGDLSIPSQNPSPKKVWSYLDSFSQIGLPFVLKIGVWKEIRFGCASVILQNRPLCYNPSNKPRLSWLHPKRTARTARTAPTAPWTCASLRQSMHSHSSPPHPVMRWAK